MVRKAVIPAAGLGTRMLPAAKAIPKELLPILDRPVIQYVVEEAAAAGINDVLLITSRGKRAIEDHFSRSAELEDRLRSKGKEALLDSVNQLIARVKIHAVWQPKQRGLGDAVLQARQQVVDEPFLCLLGDTIFSGVIPPARQLIEAHERFGGSIIGLEEVPAERVSRYGIVGGEALGHGVFKLKTLVEKPAPQSAPSRLAIAARYVLSPGIFECLDRTPAGAGGEVQLTDGLRLLLEREPIFGVMLDAQRHDIGDPAGWLQTNLLYARSDPSLWARIEPLARSLLE